MVARGVSIGTRSDVVVPLEAWGARHLVALSPLTALHIIVIVGVGVVELVGDDDRGATRVVCFTVVAFNR